MELAEVPVKEKRRITEKRKEKSRAAARCRRSRESEIFTDLSQVLPLPLSVSSNLDKASIMRLVIAHLRIRDLFKSFSLKEDRTENHDGLYIKALEGIILVLSLEGEIIYISSNVKHYLGLSQVDLMGHSIFDVCHPCDQSEIQDLLSGKIVSEGKVSTFLRIRCSLSSNKGRGFSMKSASFKVLHITGSFVYVGEDKEDKKEENFRFVTVAQPIPHPVDIQVPLGTFTFLSKHSLDMKFIYADERMIDFLGYDPESLIGRSLYNFHHTQDNHEIGKAFKCLYEKGQSATGLYRFLAQGGGYVWVTTQATIIFCDKGIKPLSVVCVNYVISERLNEVEVYSLDQLKWQEEQEAKKKKYANKCAKPEREVQARPQPATKKIFAPRTKDMNTSFLMFSDDESGMTVLKDEPEDLTHLAPTAGDVCVPLCNSPLLNDMMYILPDEYDPLLDGVKEEPLFSSFRDDCSNGSLSPALAQSPGSLPSLPLLGEDTNFEDSTMKCLFSIDVEPDNTEISSRAPYISMSEGEDLPLLIPSDLLWNINFQPASGTNTSSNSNSPIPMEAKGQPEFSNLNNVLNIDDDEDEPVNDYPETDQVEKNLGCRVSSSGDSDRRKRLASLKKDSSKKRKHIVPGPDQGGGDSVLMNLLVAGRDIKSGYVCNSPRKSNTNDSKDMH